MKFTSNYFQTADDLVNAKNDAWLGVRDRRERLKDVRAFTNMINTMTEEEAEDLGREEITNHGLTFNSMLQNETMFHSMVTTTNALVEIIVDTDNPEQDLVLGTRLSEAVNRGAIHHKGRFADFWRKVSGEIVIAGGAPVMMPERYGWLPQLKPDMFFPGETPLDSERLTYGFDPKELGMSDLVKLRASVKGEESKYVNVEGLDAVIAKLNDQIKNRSNIVSNEERTSVSVRRQRTLSRSITIPAWWYYELKFNADGSSYVSATLFIDTYSGVQIETSGKKNEVAATVIAHWEKAFETANDGIHLVAIDSEIGGVKNVSTLRGLAEMVFPSGVDMEELLNLMMEGDKMRARPKLQLTDTANTDDVKRWDFLRDLVAPAGIVEMPLTGSSSALQTPLQLLSQNAAGMSTSATANGPNGGELRQQAVERQRNSGMVQTNRLVEGYNHLDAILESVVYRLLAGDTKPGTEGYQDIMWVRAYLDRYKIDYKKLASREFGRFKYIRVRARRTVGNGDRQQQLDTSDWLMSNLQNFQPAIRPRIVHQATVLHTQDPDLADSFVKVPQAIINAQKVTAENEYDTIHRRAPLGQTLPLGEDDVHQDHIPIHLLDMQAMIAANSVRPWDKLDLIAFAGLTEHVGEHLKVLLGSPVTNAEGKAFLPDYQKITQAAQAITAEVEQRQGSEQNDLTPAEKAQLEIKAAQLHLDAQKHGLKVEDTQRLWKSRQAREMLAQRGQYAREISETRRLDAEDQRLKIQEKQADAKAAATNTATAGNQA